MPGVISGSPPVNRMLNGPFFSKNRSICDRRSGSAMTPNSFCGLEPDTQYPQVWLQARCTFHFTRGSCLIQLPLVLSRSVSLSWRGWDDALTGIGVSFSGGLWRCIHAKPDNYSTIGETSADT